MAEFDGIRAQLYKECLKEFPRARDKDIEVMKKYLAPKETETIVEVGAGNGMFSSKIAVMLKKGRLIVSDPSKEQLNEILSQKIKNIEVIEAGAEELELKKESIDAIWSFGAMHHCHHKSEAFQKFNQVLKKNGRLIIADVWSGSKLAQHFDDKVAKYCVTGHEVSFWTDEYAESLCYLNGFEKPKIIDLDIKWKFQSKKDIGIFLYKIHAMTKTSSEECLKGAEKILGIKKKGPIYELNWPMKILLSRKK